MMRGRTGRTICLSVYGRNRRSGVVGSELPHRFVSALTPATYHDWSPLTQNKVINMNINNPMGGLYYTSGAASFIFNDSAASHSDSVRSAFIDRMEPSPSHSIPFLLVRLLACLLAG
ncbi:hypothetical protein FRB91_011724 [Serendipita sp. 411]|nr:hypothetical protein FRB91_011724 [Serendipita sp. 411]